MRSALSALDTAATFGEAPEEEGGGEVLDLMEALKRSVERSRGAKAGAAELLAGVEVVAGAVGPVADALRRQLAAAVRDRVTVARLLARR